MTKDAAKPVAHLAQGGFLLFHCPGCECGHRIPVLGAAGWNWNQSLEAPTLRPSILVQGGEKRATCHSFVDAGQIRFLADCSHKLAGTTVPLPPWR